MYDIFRNFSSKGSLICSICILIAVCIGGAVEKSPLPEFGLGTVLVWKIEGTEYENGFVARLASFLPERFFEWENETGQGMVSMSERAITNGNYVTTSLFVVGKEKKTRNETTLWLSRRVFNELKEKKTAKWNLNGVTAKLNFIEEGSVPVEVNMKTEELSVIHAVDDRNTKWTFLNDSENPLLVRYEIRNYRKILASVTTGAPESLRWIKGSKLP